jgi:hypothetical protein
MACSASFSVSVCGDGAIKKRECVLCRSLQRYNIPRLSISSGFCYVASNAFMSKSVSSSAELVYRGHHRVPLSGPQSSAPTLQLALIHRRTLNCVAASLHAIALDCSFRKDDWPSWILCPIF